MLVKANQRCAVGTPGGDAGNPWYRFEEGEAKDVPEAVAEKMKKLGWCEDASDAEEAEAEADDSEADDSAEAAEDSDESEDKKPWEK